LTDSEGKGDMKERKKVERSGRGVKKQKVYEFSWVKLGSRGRRVGKQGGGMKGEV